MFLVLAGFILFSRSVRARLPYVFALIEFLNGLYHAVWTLVSGHYFPGAVTGILFMPVSLYILVNYRRFQVYS